MINLRKVHEQELFELASSRLLSWKSVEPTIAKLGFQLADDSAELMRSDKTLSWQSESVAACTFFLADKQVYPNESAFDLIRYSILVATLPEELAVSAISTLHFVAEKLSLGVSYAGSPISRDKCLALVKRWHADILAETGDACGSESVGILIEMAYDKNRK